MRFTSILIAGAAAAVAHAQSESVTATPTTSAAPSGTQAMSPAQSSSLSCLAACKSGMTLSIQNKEPSSLHADHLSSPGAKGDVNCQAACIAVPAPNETNANNTTACAAACPKSDGSADSNVAWGECVQKCISENYFASTGTPQVTGAAGSGSGSGSGSAVSSAASVVATVTSNGSTFTTTRAATSTGAQSSSTAAPTNGAGMVSASFGAGFVGLIAAVFAL